MDASNSTTQACNSVSSSPFSCCFPSTDAKQRRAEPYASAALLLHGEQKEKPGLEGGEAWSFVKRSCEETPLGASAHLECPVGDSPLSPPLSLPLPRCHCRRPHAREMGAWCTFSRACGRGGMRPPTPAADEEIAGKRREEERGEKKRKSEFCSIFSPLFESLAPPTPPPPPPVAPSVFAVVSYALP